MDLNQLEDQQQQQQQQPQDVMDANFVIEDDLEGGGGATTLTDATTNGTALDPAEMERENPFETVAAIQPQQDTLLGNLQGSPTTSNIYNTNNDTLLGSPVNGNGNNDNDMLLGTLHPSSSHNDGISNNKRVDDIDADVMMPYDDGDDQHDPTQFQNEYNENYKIANDNDNNGDDSQFQNEYDDDNNYDDDTNNDADLEEAYEDPYADSPYPEQRQSDPYSSNHHNNNHNSFSNYNDDIPADESTRGPTSNNGCDPYGELDYSRNVADTQDDMEEIEMSRNDDMNLQGGEFAYELESKDAKVSVGWQAFLQQYGKTMAYVASFLFLSGAIIAIVVLASMSGAENREWTTPHYRGADGSTSMSPWGPRNTNDAAVHIGPFVSPPLALETQCTEEAINADQPSFNACAELCEPAQCCRFDALAAPHLSCQRGHVQDCHTYHHYCSKPPKAAIVAFHVPPTNIKEVCTAENMHSAAGVTECARACVGGTCCRYPTTLEGLSCLRGNEQECQIYQTYCISPPSAHSDSDASGTTPTPSTSISFPFISPPDDMGTICAPDQVANPEGFEACVNVCHGGTCCRFDPEREPSLSCRNEQPGECPVYDQYCGGNTQTFSTAAPADPNSGSGVSGNDANNNNNNNNANSIPATYVESACSDTSLATVEGYGDCETVCNKAMCCWNDDFGACPTGSHCAPFAHCLALKNSDYENVAIQFHVNARCTDEKVATDEGNKDCMLACSQASCCFSDSGSGGSNSCPQNSDSFCEQYGACTKIMGGDVVAPASSSLKSHCVESSLGTIGGLAQCDRSCAHAPCCWKASVDSCAAENSVCNDYAPCLILNEGTQSQSSTTEASAPAVPTAPSFLADVCIESKIANIEGATLCHDACNAAECCWKTNTCTDQPQCGGYKQCTILIGSEHLDEGGVPNITPAPVSAIPEYLTTSCSAEMHASDDVHGHLCANACTKAECCWNENIDTPCTTDPNCDGYEVCATKDLDQITITTAPQSDTSTTGGEGTDVAGSDQYTGEMITDVCLNHDNSIVNLCARVCSGSECCFKDGSDCGDYPCYKYSSCSVLHPEDNTVYDACNSGDTADCVLACGDSTCCFTTDIEKSCANTNPGIVCSRFEACEKLYGFRGENEG